MKLTIPLPPQVRVVASTDYKGNPVTYLEVFGTPVLYAEGENPGGTEPDGWEEIATAWLGRIIARLLLAEGFGDGFPGTTWQTASPTGREVREHAEVELVPDTPYTP